MDIIDKILSLISMNSITVKILTDTLSLPRNSISEWKKGKCKPSAGSIIKIAQFFNVSADYLLGLSDEHTPSGNSGNLSDKEKYLLKMFNTLNETNQGIIIGRLEVMTENNRKLSD